MLGFPLVQQYRQHAADLREVAVALLLRVLVRGEVSVRHEEPRGAELEEYGYCTFIAQCIARPGRHGGRCCE